MPDLAQLLAEHRGLCRALERFPDAVRKASERSLSGLAPPPSGPLTDPAGSFDPAQGAGAR